MRKNTMRKDLRLLEAIFWVQKLGWLFSKLKKFFKDESHLMYKRIEGDYLELRMWGNNLDL